MMCGAINTSNNIESNIYIYKFWQHKHAEICLALTVSVIL